LHNLFGSAPVSRGHSNDPNQPGVTVGIEVPGVALPTHLTPHAPNTRQSFVRFPLEATLFSGCSVPA
jgi:hypothetical protein